ncbi:hypothetical protein Taro_023481 [Colocasia esculenta]|uniref:uracil phosphoribosyltransferase n=1 Tax=Colocasia esculenta TaxID=4460 RepID=A0A843V8F6_COLES|nr:hypothetical protein [Colocasia esculenta]
MGGAVCHVTRSLAARECDNVGFCRIPDCELRRIPDFEHRADLLLPPRSGTLLHRPLLPSPMATWSVKISPHSSATPRPPSSRRFFPIPPRAAFILLPPRPKCVATSGRRRRVLSCAAAASMALDNKAVSKDRMLVFVPPHPLIKHWVSVLRNEETPCAIFKSAMAELGRLLIYEASRDWLPTISGEIQTPMDVASVEFIDPREPVLLVPILRAGLALVEHASSILPATKTYHLGLRRDESTLHPSIYLNNLPDKFPEGCRVFVVDPMLATGVHFHFFSPIALLINVSLQQLCYC